MRTLIMYARCFGFEISSGHLQIYKNKGNFIVSISRNKKVQ